MQVDDHSRRDWAEHQPPHRPEEWRLANQHQRFGWRRNRQLGHVHPGDERRHEHDESGDRARHADVEQNLACRERLADSNDRAKRANLEADGTEIERQKIRQRRIELVAPARQVVAHLVRAQDGENRRAIPEAVEKCAPLGQVHAHSAKLRQEREIAELADQRGGDKRDEEERDVFPPDVLETPAWLGREHDWRVRNGRRGADYVGVEHRIVAR